MEKLGIELTINDAGIKNQFPEAEFAFPNLLFKRYFELFNPDYADLSVDHPEIVEFHGVSSRLLEKARAEVETVCTIKVISSKPTHLQLVKK